VKAPVAEAPPAPRVAAPASAPAPQKQAAPTTLAKAVVPKLKLQGIFYRPNNPSAMVNGKTLFIGDSIDGAKVTAIEADSVTIEMDGESRELTFQ
jgi:MSHA biogenesis protein MshK